MEFNRLLISFSWKVNVAENKCSWNAKNDKRKRSYQVVESQTYTDSINFFRVEEQIFQFLSFYSCPKEETHVVSAVFAVLQTKRYVLRRGKRLGKAGAGVVFQEYVLGWVWYWISVSDVPACEMCYDTTTLAQNLSRRDKTTTSHGYLLSGIFIEYNVQR